MLTAIRRDLKHIKVTLGAHAAVIDELRNESANHLRRCGELQADIDKLRKALNR